MSRLILISILILFFVSKNLACNCFTGDRDTKHLCVGKVTKKLDRTHYEFTVLRVYKGFLKKKIKIHTDGVSACGLGRLDTGDVYLLTPVFNRKTRFYDVSSCDENCKSDWARFEEDTMILGQLSTKNIIINNRRIEGQIINGKRQGKWTFHYYSDTVHSTYSGIYINGLQSGVWKNGNSSLEVYKKGKLINEIRYYPDSSRVERAGSITEEYDKKGYLTERTTSNSYETYYSNGQINEKAKIKGEGYISGFWYAYDLDGQRTIKKRVTLRERLRPDDMPEYLKTSGYSLMDMNHIYGTWINLFISSSTYSSESDWFEYSFSKDGTFKTTRYDKRNAIVSFTEGTFKINLRKHTIKLQFSEDFSYDVNIINLTDCEMSMVETIYYDKDNFVRR